MLGALTASGRRDPTTSFQWKGPIPHERKYSEERHRLETGEARL